jgi:hypothetical protein
LSIGVSLAVSISSAKAQDSLTVEQLAKVKEELLTDLRATPRADLEEQKYIMPGEKLEDADLGEPYAFYRMESECIQKLTDYRSFKQCLTFCLWEMPISFGGKARLLLSLYNKEGEWHLARYRGYQSFIENARSRWPKSKGYTLSYVMEIMGPAFIMVEKKGNIGLCPLMERSEKTLNVTKDPSGRYPLLTIPYVAKKLQGRPEMRLDPKAE